MRQMCPHTIRLLHCMGQLVGNQRLPFPAPQLILPLPEEHVLPRRESTSLNCLIQLIRLNICVNLHSTEISPKRLFH